MTENIQQNLSSTDDNYNTEYNKYFILKKGRDEFPDEWNKVIKMFPENKESVERTFYNFYKNELINRDQSFDIIPDYDDYGQSITISRSQIEKDKKLPAKKEGLNLKGLVKGLSKRLPPARVINVLQLLSQGLDLYEAINQAMGLPSKEEFDQVVKDMQESEFANGGIATLGV